MRPLKLELQAFGSFPGRVEIDFDSLAPRGVFVVSGDTGTGKTTIFDAMCWALYGEMPLKDSAGVRSDHASVGTETYVKLTFECDGVRYVVERKPTQERPAKRGSGTATEQASASLVKIGADGSELLSSKTRETSARCEELVGLDATQFQRVVLLPQGEFAKFLLSDTKERETLLGTLFGAEVFDRMVEYLKQLRNDLESQLQTVDADVKAQLDNARECLARVHEALRMDPPPSLGHAAAQTAASEPTPDTQPAPTAEEGLAGRDELGSIREAITGPLEEARAHLGQLWSLADAASAAHNNAETAARRFDDTLRHLHQLEEFAARHDEVMAGRAAARSSAKARPVVTESTALTAALERREKATTARGQRVERIAGDLTALGAVPDTSSAAAITSAFEVRSRANAEHRVTLQARDRAAEEHDEATTAHRKAHTSLGEAREALRVARADVAQIEESELPVLREQRVDPDGIRGRIDTATRNIGLRSELTEAEAALERVSAAADDATAEHQRVFESFVASQAPRLAHSLSEGHPCPVCGSEVHPAPASGDPDATTSSADLEHAAEAERRAAGAAGDAKTKAETLRAELGDQSELTSEQLESARHELVESLTAAEELIKRITACEEKLAAATEQVHSTEKTIAALEETCNNADEVLDAATQRLDHATEAAEGIDSEKVEADAAVLGTLGELVADLERLFTDAATADTSVQECRDRLDKALEVSPFESVEDACAALLEPGDETALIEAAEAHEASRTAAEAALATLHEQGVPERRPDLEQTLAAKDSAQREHDRCAGSFRTATDNAGYCDTALANHDQLVSGSEELRVQRDRAKRAHTVCNDGGALSMSLKRWVLTRELDHVTAAANVHLARMTAHRYSLHRRVTVTDGRKVFGLDLEVLDATTGRPRSTSTLSGGEQFQASLALALGLADVVSRGGAASGRRFDALFVDEGFGSLDSQSLDDAIEALHQLHATGRMVGAITHVEAMKQQLHVGIEVRRLPDGAGSTLVVNP